MQIGAAMFFTDYSMAPAELGRALEDRGFESLWAPEHSHIPVSRRTPFPGGIPIAGRSAYGDITQLLPRFHQMAAEAGRDKSELPVTMFGAPTNLDTLKQWRDLGIARVVVALDSEKADTILPQLDSWAATARALQG